MKWFKNLNALQKVMTAACGALLCLVTIGFLALSELSKLSEISFQSFSRDMIGIDAIKQAEVDEALLAGNLNTAVVSQGNAVAVGSAEHDFSSNVLDLRSSIKTAYSRAIRADSRQNLQSILDALPNVELEAHQLFAQAKTQDRRATLASLRGALLPCDQLRETLHRTAEIKKTNIETVRVQNSAVVSRSRSHFIYVLSAAFLFLSFASWAGARSFSRPLKQAVAALTKVQQGDLTPRLTVESNDEIGQLAKVTNAALNNICEVIEQVGQAARSLTEASSQLAKSTDVMAGGAHEQAASLQETSASLEQITATVRQNSDNARQASQLALSSRDAAEKGGVVVHNAISAMNEINEASGKIAAIIRVIDEIAFQTNLLAVNASVEAARAREHGKGFAVVAVEIRTLAQRSGTAAKEIKALIGDSRRKVENGSHLVNRSGQTLTDIVTSVKRVTDIVSEIAAASREQSAGIEQVNSAMLQMDSVMQSNSSQTEQLSATATMLASNALQLERNLSRFVVSTAPPAGHTHIPAKSPMNQGQQGDPAPTASADLAGLAANLVQTASIAALDEEFEEF